MHPVAGTSWCLPQYAWSEKRVPLVPPLSLFGRLWVNWRPATGPQRQTQTAVSFRANRIVTAVLISHRNRSLGNSVHGAVRFGSERLDLSECLSEQIRTPLTVSGHRNRSLGTVYDSVGNKGSKADSANPNPIRSHSEQHCNRPLTLLKSVFTRLLTL